MARLWTSGFESKHWFSEGLNATYTTSNNGVATYDTGTLRTAGTRASLKLDSGATPGTAYATYAYATTNTRYYYFRFHIKLSSTAGESNVPIFRASIAGPTAQIEVRINASNQLQLYNVNSAANIGSPSAALNNTDWYRVEIGIENSGVASTSYAELKLNGTSVASTTTANISTTVLSLFYFGWITAPAANHQIWFDDCGINDNQGAGQTGWLGDGEVWLLLPTSDNTRGTNWYDDNGGTSNLYDALNNLPPVGVAHNVATMPATAQIYNVVAGGTTADSTYNMQTYTAVGIDAGHDIILVQAASCMGTNGTTARASNTYISSNPTETPGSTVNTPAAIADVFPTNWGKQFKTVLYNPTVTRGTAPVLAVRKAVNNAAAVDFCFAGIIVESAPPLPGTQYTLYGSDDSYGAPLANASKVTTTGTGGTEIAKTNVIGGGSGNYAELWSQGGNTTAVASIPATPTGRGWLWPVPGAGTFGTDNWSAAFAYADTQSGVNGTLTVRAFKYSGGSYTAIATLASSTFNIPSGRTVPALTPAAGTQTTVAAGDYIYIDAWAMNSSGIIGGTITVYTVTDVTAGGLANDAQTTTSHFVSSGATYTRSLTSITAAVQATNTRPLATVSAAIKALGITRPVATVSAAVKQLGITRSIGTVTASVSMQYSRSLTSITAAIKALGIQRPITVVSAAIKQANIVRPLTSVTIAVKQTNITRSLTSTSAAMKALGVSRGLTSVSVAAKQTGITKSIGSVSAAVQQVGITRSLTSVTAATLATSIRPLTNVSASIQSSAATYTRTIGSVTAAIKAISVTRNLTSVSTAVKQSGVIRPLATISAVVQQQNIQRSLTALTVAVKQTDITLPLTSISVAVKQENVVRPITSVTAAIEVAVAVVDLNYYGESTSEPAGATVSGGWRYSRDDSQTGSNAVPIPALTGQNFSWYKQFAITTTDTGFTLSNFTIKNTSDPPDGIHIYFKAASSYVQPSGSNKPDDIAGSHSSSPAGYTLLTTTPQQWYAGPITINSTGRQGDFLLLVLGVGNDYAGSIGDEAINTITWACEKG